MVTSHYAQIIEQLPVPPVLIGYSFGGMIAEKLLGEELTPVVLTRTPRPP